LKNELPEQENDPCMNEEAGPKDDVMQYNRPARKLLIAPNSKLLN